MTTSQTVTAALIGFGVAYILVIALRLLSDERGADEEIKRSREYVDEWVRQYQATPCSCPPSQITGHLPECARYPLEQQLFKFGRQ